MLPNLIIAGVPRAGTTSLFTWLADHPDIVGSNVKETCYFVDPDAHSFRADANYRDHGVAGYQKFFPSESSAAVILESTPQYIYQKTALDHLPELASKPKFIFILRHPAEQILSSFNYFRSNWDHLDREIAFADFIELARAQSERLNRNELLRNAIGNCDYEQHLQSWFDRVGKERIRVYIFEELKNQRLQLMESICQFAGIDSSFYRNYEFPLENYSYQLRSYALQQLNIRLRSLIPISQRSAVWRSLRSFYRRINTKQPETKADAQLSAVDQQAYEGLRQQFAPAYARLVERYGLGGGMAG